MSLKTKQKPTELDHIRDTLTDVVDIIGSTRQEVKKLDKKVDTNHQEICQRLDQQDNDMAGVKTDITNMKTVMTGVKTDIANMKTVMTGVKTDIGNMEADIVDLKTDVTGMKADIAEVKVEVKAINNRFDQLELLIRQSLPTN